MRITSRTSRPVSRRIRPPVSCVLHQVDEPPHELGVGLVAGARRDHVRVQVGAEQAQVAEQVEQLVAHGLAGHAQRGLPGVAEHDACSRACAPLPRPAACSASTSACRQNVRAGAISRGRTRAFTSSWKAAADRVSG